MSAPERRRTFHFTRAKRQTLEVLAEYFCLRVCDLAKLLRKCEPNQNDLRTARRTLYLLWKEGLLNRLPYIELDRERGSVCYVYGLSDKGVRNYGGGLSKSFDEHSSRTLDHELEISWFHLALAKLCEKYEWTLYWQQADLKTRTIHPDAYFAVTDLLQPEDKNTHHFFLEIERSKTGKYKDGESSIFRKLVRYYDLFDTPDCEKDWGFRQFRVIVVLHTEHRRRNLCTAFAEQYRHRMFWLTTEPLYKQDIAGEIFLTPKDGREKPYALADIF